jgi:proteasome lid subunit RPN8/RPN11
VTLKISARLVESFELAAKRAFPRETYGFLLGTPSIRSTVVERIWIAPLEGLKDYSTEAALVIAPEWTVAALEMAEEEGLKIIGDIHSHPYRYWKGASTRDRTPSEYDFDGQKLPIMGICCVTEQANRSLRASTRFWPQLRPLKVTLT